MRARKKVLVAFGTRPEAIKMAPVLNALRAKAGKFETLCCVTAQHRAMLDQMLQVFAIEPDFDLGLMRVSQDAADLHARVLTGMRNVIRKARPDVVLVHGDTTSTMATAQAAFYAGAKVGHVEAGLRSGRLDAPFPEEFNRRLTSLVATLHFAPTELARDNLLREGTQLSSISVTGNTVVDAVALVQARIARDPALRWSIERALDANLPFAWRTSPYVIITCHRRESIQRGLEGLCAAIATLALRHPERQFVFPVHPNPAVAAPVNSALSGLPNLQLIEPMRYDAFLHLLAHCELIVSDSGGLQEEGPTIGKPVLVMRDVTERPEAIASGCAILVGTDPDRVVSQVSALLGDCEARESMAAAPNPFGNGRAAERIVDVLAAL